MPIPHDIANAYLKVAEADHYLVSVATDYISNNFTEDEFNAAKDILVDIENYVPLDDLMKRASLALDLLENDRKSINFKDHIDD